MDGNYGTKETKDLIQTVKAFVVAAEQAGDDGQYTLNDIVYLVPVFTGLPQTIDGLGNVPKELGDLSEAEVAELRAEVGDIIDDPNFLRAFAGAFNLFNGIKGLISQ